MGDYRRAHLRRCLLVRHRPPAKARELAGEVRESAPGQTLVRRGGRAAVLTTLPGAGLSPQRPGAASPRAPLTHHPWPRLRGRGFSREK